MFVCPPDPTIHHVTRIRAAPDALRVSPCTFKGLSMPCAVAALVNPLSHSVVDGPGYRRTVTVTVA